MEPQKDAQAAVQSSEGQQSKQDTRPSAEFAWQIWWGKLSMERCALTELSPEHRVPQRKNLRGKEEEMMMRQDPHHKGRPRRPPTRTSDYRLDRLAPYERQLCRTV